MIMNRLFPRQLLLNRRFDLKVMLALLSLLAFGSTEFGQHSTALGVQSSSRGSTSRGGSSSRTVPAAKSRTKWGGPPVSGRSNRSSTDQGSSSKTQDPTIGGSGSSTRNPTVRSRGSTTTSPNQGSATNGGNPNRQPTYRDIVIMIQQNESEINNLFSSIPIGFPAEQKEHMDKINALKANNEKLKSMLDTAALQSFQQDPGNNPRAALLVYKQMKMNPREAQQHFDPRGAFQIASVLIKSGGLDDERTPGKLQFRDVAWQAFRASYAIQDFASADLMLKKIAEENRLSPKISETLEKTRERWQRELKIRRLEGSFLKTMLQQPWAILSIWLRKNSTTTCRFFWFDRVNSRKPAVPTVMEPEMLDT